MRQGFTIIEVLVASAVLAIGSLGVLAMLTLAYGKNIESRERVKATALAENVLSQLERESRSWVGTKPKYGTQLRDVYDNARFLWYEIDEGALYNELGRVPVNTTEIGAKYRIAYYLVRTTNDVLSGGIRVIWSKDAQQTCAPASFADFDTLASSTASANVRACDFITLPFSFVRN